jgi:hypothetical protein
MDQERHQFWDDLLAYYRQELQERQSPAMVSMLGFFHGEEQALEDKNLAERGYVYLLVRGKLRIKHIDQPSGRLEHREQVLQNPCSAAPSYRLYVGTTSTTPVPPCSSLAACTRRWSNTSWDTVASS